MDAGEEIAGGFLIAGCDAAEVLDGIEEALNQVALGVESEIAVAGCLAVRFRRNDRFDGADFEAFDEATSVICFVGDECFGRGLGGEHLGLRDVVRLAAGEAYRERVAQGIDDGVYFCREAAARAAYGLIASPFLRAPALC